MHVIWAVVSVAEVTRILIMIVRYKIHGELGGKTERDDIEPAVNHYVHLIIAMKVLSSIAHWIFSVTYLEIVLNVTLTLDPNQSGYE